MRFEELKVEVPRTSNPSPIEVTLFEGIKPTLQASSVPYAHAGDKVSDKPGLILVGYFHEIEGDELKMTPDRIAQGSTQMGGWHIGRGAIHSIRQLEYRS